MICTSTPELLFDAVLVVLTRIVLNAVEAVPVRDAKLSPRAPGFGTPWVSTSDQTWRRYAGDIKSSFQKPSRWER